MITKSMKEKLNELLDIQSEVRKITSEIKEYENKGTEVAFVKGSAKDFPFSTLPMKVIAQNPIVNEEVNRYVDILRNRLIKLLKVQNDVEEYLDTLPTTRLRQIFEYRYIYRYTWAKISTLIYGATEDSVRLEHDRFLKDNE